MVEQITAETMRRHLEALSGHGILTEGLSKELSDLSEGMDGFSNWLDARKYLVDTGAIHLSGSGPIGKFIRTLTYSLEQMVKNADLLKDREIKLDRVQLADTTSGCSDFRGSVQILALNDKGEDVLLWDGRFHWDCAEHGMPQPQAAQSLGYRCMIHFPELDPQFAFADRSAG